MRGGSTSAGSTSPYFEDSTQVKFGKLEPESAFFERVEKEIKIEEVRLDANDARQGLIRVRSRLAVSDVELLEIVDREVRRAFDPLDTAGRNLVLARTELQAFHQGAGPQMAVIAAGKSSAVPLVARVRRLIKTAEWDLTNLSQGLVEGRASPQEQLDKARDSLANRINALPADDARREKLQQSLAAVDAAVSALKDLDAEAKSLASQLKATRVRYFAECPPNAAPALAPPTDAGSSRAPVTAACESYSLDLLRNSAPALAELDAATARHEQVNALLERVVGSKLRAVELAERADAIVNPANGKARELQAAAVQMLDDVEGKLAAVRRSLTQDAPGDVRHCAHCGKAFARTRKVLDPSCVCAESNGLMLDAEQLLAQAQRLSNDIVAVLTKAEPPDASQSRQNVLDELRGDKKVLDQLALARQHGEEFRTQQFNFYPGESFAPPSEPMPDRAFAPMVAYYAARESWHYPLYFDDLSLERYGHDFGCVQPLVSYGKFLTDLAFVPYNMCLEPPLYAQYDLGLYRPGDDVPHLIYLPRPNLKAALFEISVWTGLAYIP